MEAETELRAEVGRQNFRLPSTHDRLALGEFEEKWRNCLVLVLRQTGFSRRFGC